MNNRTVENIFPWALAILVTFVDLLVEHPGVGQLAVTVAFIPGLLLLRRARIVTRQMTDVARSERYIAWHNSQAFSSGPPYDQPVDGLWKRAHRAAAFMPMAAMLLLQFQPAMLWPFAFVIGYQSVTWGRISRQEEFCRDFWTRGV